MIRAHYDQCKKEADGLKVSPTMEPIHTLA